MALMATDQATARMDGTCDTIGSVDDRQRHRAHDALRLPYFRSCAPSSPGRSCSGYRRRAPLWHHPGDIPLPGTPRISRSYLSPAGPTAALVLPLTRTVSTRSFASSYE